MRPVVRDGVGGWLGGLVEHGIVHVFQICLWMAPPDESDLDVVIGGDLVRLYRGRPASGRAGEGRELPVSQLGFGFGTHETTEVIHAVSSFLEIRCGPVPLGLVCSDAGSEGAV